MKHIIDFQKIRTPVIYTLLQIPGFLFLGIILVLANERGWITALTAWMVISAWAIKDVFFYRFYKKALSHSPKNIIARLHGSCAVVKTTLDPAGQVALRGEIWRAESTDGQVHQPGERVMVEGNRGLTLEVRKK